MRHSNGGPLSLRRRTARLARILRLATPGAGHTQPRGAGVSGSQYQLALARLAAGLAGVEFADCASTDATRLPGDPTRVTPSDVDTDRPWPMAPSNDAVRAGRTSRSPAAATIRAPFDPLPTTNTGAGRASEDPLRSGPCIGHGQESTTTSHHPFCRSVR